MYIGPGRALTAPASGAELGSVGHDPERSVRKGGDRLGSVQEVGDRPGSGSESESVNEMYALRAIQSRDGEDVDRCECTRTHMHVHAHACARMRTHDQTGMPVIEHAHAHGPLACDLVMGVQH